MTRGVSRTRTKTKAKPIPNVMLLHNNSLDSPLVDYGTVTEPKQKSSRKSKSAKSMDNKELVIHSLRAILMDDGASAAAKASAARTLAEIEGALGRHATPPKDTSRPLASLTRDELEALLQEESAGISD